MHVNNTNISLYKMEMDKLVGVVVKMNYLTLLCMVPLHVVQLEVHGVITYGKITIIKLQFHNLFHNHKEAKLIQDM